ncbi:MAG: response regulator, partial [Candidatus Kapaibacteriota bacterium]
MSNNLLLIEDDAGMVFTVSDRLIAEGYTVETALDGRSGLEQAKKKQFDLILLDVMLPEKNG